MTDKLHFELVSPERLLKSADVDMVVVPGTEGDFGVLSQHAPVVSNLRTGIIEVHSDDSEVEKLVVVGGGFAEVNAEGLTVLAELAMPIAEIDRAAYEAKLKNLEEDIHDAKNDDIKARAERERDQIVALLEVLNQEAA